MKVDRFNTTILIAENAVRTEELLREIGDKTNFYELMDDKLIHGETLLLQVEKIGRKHYKVFLEIKDPELTEAVN